MPSSRTDNLLPIEVKSIVGCNTTTAAERLQSGSRIAVAVNCPDTPAVTENQEAQVSTTPQNDAPLVTAKERVVNNNEAALTITTLTKLDEEHQHREPGSTIAGN